MPGSVHVSPAGQVSGWAFRRGLAGRRAQVDLLLDGRRLVRLPTSEPSATAQARDARAANAGFSYRIPHELRDGRVHELRARLVWGEELAGSPSVWEPWREGAPARSFVLEREPSAMRQRGDAVPLVQGGRLLFDARGFRTEYAGRGGQLVQNRPDIGGLPGHRRYRPPPAYLATFRDHVVDAAFGGVYRPQGAIWQGSAYLANSHAMQVTRQQMRAGGVGEAPAERCFLLCNSVKDTYFHWHLDGLAGLVMARERLGGGFKTLAPPSLNAWQAASLKLLGEAVEPVAGACRPHETIVASHFDGRGISPDRWVVKLFQRLHRAHLASTPPRRSRGVGRRVFISRRDAGHRVLENEAELWEALQTRGFTRLTPGEASYAEQIDAFANAEVVVASHGSALTNMGYCRPRTTIVEILPADYINGCFRYLAIAFGLRHAWYATELTSPFRVDVGAFMSWCAGQDLF